MAIQEVLKGIGLGFQKHWQRFLVATFMAFGISWTIIESLDFLSIYKMKEESKFTVFVLMILISCVYGTYRSYHKRSIRFKIKTTNSFVTILCGDIFETEGKKVIPVNEFFDSQLGDLVAESSVHGQLIVRNFGNNYSFLDQLVAKDLAGNQHEVVKRKKGNTKKFPIGTTAIVCPQHEDFFLVALCHTDLQTLKAYAGVPELWKALSDLWEHMRNKAANQKVSLPLIGGGLSGIDLPPMHLLQLIVLSFVVATKKNKITNEIQILIFDENDFRQIDLERIERDWS